MIELIVAMTKDRVIGARNALPWRIPEELKRFKKITTGHTIIMGRKTYQSIGRPLPKRHNIVLSDQPETIEGAQVCHSIDEALTKARSYGKKIFVIGGAQIFAQMLPQVDVMHISHVKKNYPGDIYFPEYNLNDWQEIGREEHDEFTAVTYKRKNAQRA